MTHHRRLLFILALALACAAWGQATTQAESTRTLTPAQSERGSGYRQLNGWVTHHDAVVSANPLASQAGLEILRGGGNAMDAAVAVQMVLGLVEAQSSGIGGGAFLLHFDGTKVEAFDGRETAPAAVDERLFLGKNGNPMQFYEAVVGGRAVGVPGAVAMLYMAHQQYGKLPWARLFEPAIALATNGFAVSPRMARLLASDRYLQRDPVAAAYFLDRNGQPWPAGHLLKNPEYAGVLRLIADQGAKALSEGEVASALVRTVQQHPVNPGRMDLYDLKSYQARKREPLCSDYSADRATQTTPIATKAQAHQYRICGMPPPSSGGLAVAQILGLLSRLPEVNASLGEGFSATPFIGASTPANGKSISPIPSADWLHFYTEAARLAFADRDQYVADPDFVAAPAGHWTSLLQPAYLDERAQLINLAPNSHTMNRAPAGAPGTTQVSYAPMPAQPEYGTSHLSVIDAQGHAVAMTTSIETAWGAHIMVNRGVGLTGGFLLNNQLTDFSFKPRDAQGLPIANRVQGGKRPRSSMAPTLVFEKPVAGKDTGSAELGPLVMSGGSALGAMIIHAVTKELYATLNWGLDVQQAMNMPNFAALNGPNTLLEARRFPRATLDALTAREHTVREIDFATGSHFLQKTPTGYFGGADPRREGVVLGD